MRKRQGLTRLGARVPGPPPGCAAFWLCDCRTVAFPIKASVGSFVRGWISLRKKEMHGFSTGSGRIWGVAAKSLLVDWRRT